MRNSYLFLLLLFSSTLYAQKLKPGFDKAEYMEMLKIAQKQHIDVDRWGKGVDSLIPVPQKFKQAYRSPVMGLDNMWDLWLSEDSIAVISVRGTTANPVSFLANFYAAMVPAKGELHLDNSFTFNYNVCSDPKAAVHVGWLVSTAYVSRDILPKIDSCYKKLGIRNFIITGHSQGGAIVFLLTSYLENLRSENKIPNDIRFKTYCGAGPKPGNLYFAYYYEHLTRNGWAYNIVNSADWVPETPFTVQTVDDFNTVNLFKGAKKMIKKQKFPINIALNHVYNKMDKPSRKALKSYQKYLGKMASKAVVKQLPEFKAPVYFNSNNYVRTGATIVLYAEGDYFKLFPQNQNAVWQNHLVKPYLYLMERWK